MDNEFTQVMSERTDEQLIKIITVDFGKYQSHAIEAAQLEIEQRNIDISNFEQLKERAVAQKERQEKVNSNVVGSGVRLLNYIIDFFIAYLLAMAAYITLGFFLTLNSDNIVNGLATLLVVFGTFLGYYALMEIKYQKTIGKYITNTKVVDVSGNKPIASVIITRTLCRLIPFDGISYLFAKNGLHDYLSKTKVVKDDWK